jgi:hypothetical protein
MLVCSRHWTLVQAKRYLKRWRNVDEAVARGLARRRCRVLGHRLCWRDRGALCWRAADKQRLEAM